MDELLRFLLTEPPTPAPLGSVEDWWTRHLPLSSRFSLPVDVAFAGGFAADRLGYAFASGYHSALRTLFPQLPPQHRYALCVTEAGGGHPSAMQTRLTGPGEGPFAGVAARVRLLGDGLPLGAFLSAGGGEGESDERQTGGDDGTTNPRCPRHGVDLPLGGWSASYVQWSGPHHPRISHDRTVREVPQCVCQCVRSPP